jgi:hypothetical protein
MVRCGRRADFRPDNRTVITDMAIIIRIDVDRPYGKRPLLRHLLSRCGSDLYFPRTEALGYLRELKEMLQILSERGARAYAFFRRCTLPSDSIMELIEQGRHEIGLHLENSRSFETFHSECRLLEQHIGKKVMSFSKHGSGGAKYGYQHYPPYEPGRYVQWAKQAQMKVFFGNLEDPTLRPQPVDESLSWYPAAFWLEPFWRDTEKFSVDWLLAQAGESDIVLLLHPENVLCDPALVRDFQRIVGQLESKIVP